MKYIKTYKDDNIPNYKIDDFVIVDNEIAKIIHKFVGNVGWYKIEFLEKSLIDRSKSDLPLSLPGGKDDVVYWTHITRKLEPHEIDALIKYNL
jgi:hypothetical protein